ncbi:MAG: PhnD/SsuA/transferrin family substrate-binding protein, partial [Nitrospirae bacterium]|nr:PhnD/SsuA/transferrin family substrate-binding protein [Nitrospirota bacterium]
MSKSVLKKAAFTFLLLALPAAFEGIGLPGSAGSAGSGWAEVSPPQAAQEAPLRFGVLYLLSPKELYERWTPFAEYLSRKTGRKVDLVIPRNFDHLVELARSGQLDLLFINPYVYILLKKEIGVEPVAAQVAYGNTFAPSYIVVRKDSGIKTLDDLRGKRIAFVSHLASSGYLVPRAYLMSQGIDVDREMKVVFTKNLRAYGDAVRQWLTGTVDVRQALWTRRYDVASELLAGGRAWEEEGSLGEGLRYDLKLRAPGTLRIDNNLATLQATADLALQGSYEAPLVLGRATIDRGRV